MKCVETPGVVEVATVEGKRRFGRQSGSSSRPQDRLRNLSAVVQHPGIWRPYCTKHARRRIPGPRGSTQDGEYTTPVPASSPGAESHLANGVDQPERPPSSW